MKVGALKESKNNEYRASLTPSSVVDLKNQGHEVYIQSGLGHGINFEDEDYSKVGATIVNSTEELIAVSSLIIKVKEPTEQECLLLNEDKVIFTYLHLAAFPTQHKLLKESKSVAIAYETVTSPNNGLPLLAPMSEVAGRLAILAGGQYLLKSSGGKGIVLNGVPGCKQAKVVIIGAGVVGINALITAVGVGSQVVILDTNIDKLRELDKLYGNRITTLYSSQYNIIHSIKDADMIIGAVLIPGGKAPKLITKDMLKLLQKKTVIIDVAIDQGGCFETSRPTTYDNPVYEVDGIIHYCVANMPGAVSSTSSFALTNATLPYILQLANHGYRKACINNIYLRQGLNIMQGKVVNKTLAESINEVYVDPIELL